MRVRRFSLSLTLKAFLLTGMAGIFFWFVQDLIQSRHLRTVFDAHLRDELEKNARSDWLRLNELFHRQNQFARLVAAGEPLSHHVRELEEMDWTQDREVRMQTGNRRPPWLPGSSVTRGLINLSHLLLLDPEGRIRELATLSATPFPSRFVEEWDMEWDPSGSRNRIQEDGGIPYLLTTVPLENRSGGVRAYLVLVAAMDEEFLLSFQMQGQSGSIMVFLDEDSGAVLASSRPDLVARGRRMDELRGHYAVMDKAFLDYGFSSDVFVQFATLVPLEHVRVLSASILIKERVYRSSGHGLMIVVFLTIVTWLVGRIDRFTREMLEFSRDRLGLETRTPVAGGDQLQVMREQFFLLGEEITRARRREMDQKLETDLANQALRDSLVMVRRTQSQLVESEKMASLGGLVAGVAHEINTPIGIGVTAASFLERKSRECRERFASGELKRSDLEGFLEDAGESTRMILSNLERAAALVRSFKQVAVDQTSEERRRFVLRSYLDDVLASLRPRLKRTSHTVTVRCPEGLEIDSFPGALAQVITNLLVNSLIHGFEEGVSGRIGFDLALDDEGWLLFGYFDDGRGMDEAVRTRIFEPFFTTARGQGGSGLGMHIVYNLVTRTLGGTIVCESAPGRGVRFTMRIPTGLEPGERNIGEGETA